MGKRRFGSIAKRWTFQALLKGELKLIFSSFIVFYDVALRDVCAALPAESAHSQGLKIGLIASKKVGNAVYRNRCKRLLRAACDNYLKITKYDFKDTQVVFIARHKLLEIEFQRLIYEIGVAFHKIHKYRELIKKTS